MTVARPFRLVGDSDRRALARALGEPARRWARAWFAQAPATGFDCVPPPADEVAGEWQIVGDDADGWIAWQHGNAVVRSLASQLFPGAVAGGASGSLTGEVVAECLSDLAGACLAAAGLPSSHPRRVAPAALATGHGSGAQFARLTGEGLDALLFAFGGAVVESLVAPDRPVLAPRPLQPRQAAIGAGSIRLEVALGDAELSLAELASLAVGDVIALDGSPREPLAVRTAGGHTAFRAHLGRNAERKVIQVSGL